MTDILIFFLMVRLVGRGRNIFATPGENAVEVVEP
jgi:hypothetical protein